MRFVLVIFLSVIVFSCSSTNKFCEPGRQLECTCAGGVVGFQICSDDGSSWGECACPCVPNCSNKDCGDDGCEGSCGGCDSGQVCKDGSCCTPDCYLRQCGPDPVCHDDCGSCGTVEVCTVTGNCISGCTPDCGNRVCGPDQVCNTSCGECLQDEICTDEGQCISGCTPDCGIRECGPDPACSFICGICEYYEECTTDGTCDLLVMDLLPESGEISGWLENTDWGNPGPEGTDDLSVATMWVDGAMDIFTSAGGWVALAREFYINGDTRISLFIYEMSNATTAGQVYDSIELYSGVQWSDFSFGGGEDRGRFGTIYTECYADAVKGKYFAETRTEPETAETEAKYFIKSVLDKIQP